MFGYKENCITFSNSKTPKLKAMCVSSRFTIVMVIFLQVGFAIAGESSSPYYPPDDIAINCGSSGNSLALDGREWIGDVQSKFTLSSQPKGKSASSRALHKHHLSADHVPYTTARISRSRFTYTFRVSPGQKFIRLHFYPSSYIGFKVSNSFFSVKAGPYTLLSNFSASLTAEALGVEFFAKEFIVNVDDNQSLSIDFFPSLSASSGDVYAFINGIEIVSMPIGLYYSSEDDLDLGVPVVGEKCRFYVDNRTALETVYRLNIGGRSILLEEDLGMYRSWYEDRNYFLESDAISVRYSAMMIKYRNIPTHIAPLKLYQTTWSMGPKEESLIWKLPVNLGFRYLVRLHFCQLASGVTKSGQRNFSIFINNQTVEIDADVIKWSGGNGVPVYRDYVVTMKGEKTEDKRDLILILQPKPKRESGIRQNDALLNGLEIFKLSNLDDNLAEPNPISKAHASTSWTSKLRRLVLAFGGENLISARVTLVLTIVNIVVYQFNYWGTNSGGKNEMSSLKDESCRRFSLAEIKLATNNFDDAFVVGNGGFGKVYKGSIDNGARTVAFKRSKLESKQGAAEFRTEIETLSTFRHVHLVSLIGYCDEGQEMLLVYEYMGHGTLADHLYKVRNKISNGNVNSPLSWERRLRICIGVAHGLDYLHTGRGARHGLVHRDVKSSNILLDENWVAKISDFGLSKNDTTNLSRTHISTDIKGTFGYFDPNYFMTRRLTRKSDIYAFGVVLFEVLCGRPAVNISLDEEQHSLVLWARHCIQEGKLDQIVDPNVREQISPQCLNAFVEIAIKCLHNSPKERPTMAEVVTSLVSVLRRQGSAYFNTDEEDIDVGDRPRIKKKDHASNRGLPRSWRWDSFWRRAKPSKEKTPPLPEELCRYFSFREIEEATDNFTRFWLIGEDTASEVYIGVINDMMPVIVQPLTSNASHKEFLTEVQVLSQLQHPNLVPLFGYCQDKSTMILMYDYMAHGVLYDHLHYTANRDLFSWKRRLQTCIYAARGLNYLHTGTKQTIIHGDVNLRNILLENGWVAKVLKLGGHTFGDTKLFPTDISTIPMGTLEYIDPEYWVRGTLTVKSDVYSLGIVLFEVLCGGKVIDMELEEEPRHLYVWAKDRKAAGMIDQIIDPSLVGKISPDCLHAFLDIANECLLVRGTKRPTMLHVVGCLEHALELQENADAIGGGNYQPR